MDPAGHGRERVGQHVVIPFARAYQNVVPRGFKHFGSGAFVHHLKMRCKARFDREPAQQRFTKRMNGLHLQPARRIKHLRKQSSGQRPRRIVRRRAGQGDNGGGQRRVFHHRPFAEQAADPVLHFSGRRARECQAENFPGIGARQQQAQHPVGQHLGLAGPGGGRHPDRRGRRRRYGLVGVFNDLPWSCRNGFGDAFGGTFGNRLGHSLPPVAAHSCTRSRCSKSE